MPEPTDPPPLFHGTRRPFAKGGLLLPRSTHGSAATSAPLSAGQAERTDSHDFVYVTTNPDVAWVYAWHAPGRGKPRVLTVRPLGPVEPDPEHSARMEAYRCEAATVLAVDKEPLISEQEAAAGWVTEDTDRQDA